MTAERKSADSKASRKSGRMSENWKPVLGYEGHYEISDYGRVRGVERVVPHPMFGTMTKKAADIKLKSHKDGYLVVTLHREGKRKTRMVHQLVLESFREVRPEGMETRHLDGNPKNNHISNLKWGTPKENSADIDLHGNRYWRNQTHCIKGHPFSGDNLMLEREGKKRVCRECRRAKDRKIYARDKAEGKYGISNRDKTHCKNGHEFSPENTSFEREGKKRVCRTCRRDRERARRVATKSKI